MRLLHDGHADVTVYGDDGNAGIIGHELGEIQAAVDDLNVRALFEVTGRIVPLAENLLLSLGDVLCDVVASSFVIVVDVDTGRVTVLPSQHVEHRTATVIQDLLSGIWTNSRSDGYAAEGTKPVEVDGSVLMQFRDEDVTKPLTLTGVSQKSLHLFADLGTVIAVYQLRVKRPSEEAGEAVAKGDVPNGCLCSAAAYGQRAGRVICLTFRRDIIRALPWLISRLAENSVIGDLQDVQGGVRLNPGIRRDVGGCNGE